MLTNFRQIFSSLMVLFSFIFISSFAEANVIVVATKSIVVKNGDNGQVHCILLSQMSRQYSSDEVGQSDNSDRILKINFDAFELACIRVKLAPISTRVQLNDPPIERETSEKEINPTHSFQSTHRRMQLFIIRLVSILLHEIEP